MEDVQVKYDATVRTSKDQIIQFLYGEDGLGAEYIENVFIPSMKMDDKSIEKSFKFFKAEDITEKQSQLSEYIPKSIIEEGPQFDEMCQKLD